MRKLFIFTSAMLVVIGTAPAAVAESRSIGTRTEGQVIQACLTNGGKMEYYQNGNFTCKTDKGEVSCKKTGTLNQGAVGSCIGCNPACGQGVKVGGKTSRTIGEVLTNAPVKTAQPLAPQKTTMPATAAPRRPVTQPKPTRSPKSAPGQPLTQQQTTTSPGPRPVQTLAGSQSSRRSTR